MKEKMGSEWKLEWIILDPTLENVSTWNIVLGEEEISLLLELFEVSQDSRLLIKNASHKGLEHSLSISSWQGK